MYSTADKYHDLFISYKHFEAENLHAQNNPNNKKYTESVVEMIEAEIEQLLKSKANQLDTLNQVLKSKEVCIWMDKRMEINLSVKKALIKHITSSDRLLVFLSNEYINSEWCDFEMGYFAKHKISSDKIFVIRLEEISDEAWPEALKDESNEKLRGIKLYDSSDSNFNPFCWPALNTKDPDYVKLFSKVRDLAEQIVDDIVKELENEQSANPIPGPSVKETPNTSKPKIFLAPHIFNKEINELYSKLKTSLNDKFYCIPDEAIDEYEQIVEYAKKEIKTSDLFVQVIGGNNEGGLTNKLCSIAEDAQIPVKLWIHESLNIHDLQQQSHRNWICSKEYSKYSSIEEIIKNIEAHFDCNDPKPFEQKLDIYLRPESTSLFQFTDRLRQKILDLGVRCYVLSPKALEMKEIGEEDYITFCDAYMIIRSEKETNWIMNRIRKAAYFRQNNRHNLKSKDIYISVIDAPPPPAASQFDLGIEIFDCTRNEIDNRLVEWITSLKQKKYATT